MRSYGHRRNGLVDDHIMWSIIFNDDARRRDTPFFFRRNTFISVTKSGRRRRQVLVRYKTFTRQNHIKINFILAVKRKKITTALYYLNINIAMTPRGRLTVKLRVFCKIKEYNIAIVLCPVL